MLRVSSEVAAMCKPLSNIFFINLINILKNSDTRVCIRFYKFKYFWQRMKISYISACLYTHF